ncbi:MAG TPA: endonuclease/exonuclease/phosphatase family protein [Polyangiaceae bacterium]|nr:endonuclease/exonuclease/phosphatase family protein [Polyangiaceae bacterium]
MMRSTLALLAASLISASSGLAAAASGHLKVLTYNIAGLPDGFMTPHPSANMPQIGARLARYDLALIQEDFVYGALLRQSVTLPFQTPAFERAGRFHFGDGLSQFANRAFTGLQREPWRACHGLVDSYYDCLTPKGFASTRQRLAEGVEIDVYNVHLDAGPSGEDQRAREAQLDQLAEAIAHRSQGRPVLLAGDTNLRSAGDSLARFEESTGLVNVCERLHCPEPRRIDRVFYRNSPTLTFSPRKWTIDRRFVDHQGKPLSDHLAVAVELAWKSAEPSSAAAAAIAP